MLWQRWAQHFGHWPRAAARVATHHLPPTIYATHDPPPATTLLTTMLLTMNTSLTPHTSHLTPISYTTVHQVLLDWALREATAAMQRKSSSDAGASGGKRGKGGKSKGPKGATTTTESGFSMEAVVGVWEVLSRTTAVLHAHSRANGGANGGAGGAELSATAGLLLLQFAVACSVEADNEPSSSSLPSPAAAAAAASSSLGLADTMCMTLRRMMAMGGTSQTSGGAGGVDTPNGHTNGYAIGYAMYAPSLDVVLDCLVGLHSKVSADGRSESGAASACVESLELLLLEAANLAAVRSTNIRKVTNADPNPNSTPNSWPEPSTLLATRSFDLNPRA